MKRFSILAALAASDLAVGFSIQIYVLLSVGVGETTDAFFAGQVVPIVLLGIVQLPIQRAAVAAFADLRGQRYPAVRLALAVVASMATMVGIVALLAPWAVGLLYSKFSTDAQATAVSVLRVQGLAVTVMAGNLILLSANQVTGRFLRCEAALLTSSVAGGIFVVLMVERLGVVAAAYGQLAKAMLCAALYWVPLRHELTFGSPSWRGLVRTVMPLVSAGALTKLGPLIDRSIASGASAGGLTVITFTQSMYSATGAVAERALIAPRIPQLVRGTSAQQLLRVAAQLAAAGGLVTVALFSSLYVASKLDLLSRFVEPSVSGLLVQCTVWLVGLSVATLSVQWMVAALTVCGRAGVAARIVLWGVLLSVPLKVLGFALDGIRGLAFGISTYYVLNMLAFAFAVRGLKGSAPASS